MNTAKVTALRITLVAWGGVVPDTQQHTLRAHTQPGTGRIDRAGESGHVKRAKRCLNRMRLVFAKTTDTPADIPHRYIWCPF